MEHITEASTTKSFESAINSKFVLVDEAVMPIEDHGRLAQARESLIKQAPRIGKRWARGFYHRWQSGKNPD